MQLRNAIDTLDGIIQEEKMAEDVLERAQDRIIRDILSVLSIVALLTLMGWVFLS